MEKQVVDKIEYKTEVYCDHCGIIVSNGNKDYNGFLEFIFGTTWLTLMNEKDKTITIKLDDVYKKDIIVKFSQKYEDSKYYVLCEKCSSKIKNFIEGKTDDEG